MAELEERNEPTQVGASGGGFRSKLMRLTLGLVVLGLAASTLYLLAERNSRFYYLSQEGGSLVVSRGAWLPSGKRPYLPEDPRSAQIYAPIALPADAGPFAVQRFGERQELDRALFDLLAELADTRIRSDRMETMQEGFAFVERASLLPGISAEQATKLRALRAELSFFEGRAHLQEAVVQLRQAREKLELATEASSARGEEAAVLLRRLVPATEILSRTLQRSKGWGSEAPVEELQGEGEPLEEPSADLHRGADGRGEGAAPQVKAPRPKESRGKEPRGSASAQRGEPRGAAAMEQTSPEATQEQAPAQAPAPAKSPDEP